MADYEDPDCINAELDGTEVDTIVISGGHRTIEIYNREDVGGANLWFTTNGNDPEAEAAGSYIVPAGTAKEIGIKPNISEYTVKVLGNDNLYSVSGGGQ